MLQFSETNDMISRCSLCSIILERIPNRVFNISVYFPTTCLDNDHAIVMDHIHWQGQTLSCTILQFYRNGKWPEWNLTESSVQLLYMMLGKFKLIQVDIMLLHVSSHDRQPITFSLDFGRPRVTLVVRQSQKILYTAILLFLWF